MGSGMMRWEQKTSIVGRGPNTDRSEKGVPWLPTRVSEGRRGRNHHLCILFSRGDDGGINPQFSMFPVLTFPKCSAIKTRKQTLAMAFILTDTRGTVTESLCLTFTSVGSCCYPDLRRGWGGGSQVSRGPGEVRLWMTPRSLKGAAMPKTPLFSEAPCHGQ